VKEAQSGPPWHGGGMNPSTGGIVLLLRVGGDHVIEFLSELGGLGSLAGVVGGHRMWFHGT
jgi:hypothetical protein